MVVRVHVAWWLGVYLCGLMFVHRLTGAEPDWDKVSRIVELAVRIKTPGPTRLGFWFKLMRCRAKQKALTACRRAVSMVRPWVHTPLDGRGMRAVYLDGRRVDRVIYADTRAGFIRLHHDPIRVCPRREVIRSYKRRGDVRVVILPEQVTQ